MATAFPLSPAMTTRTDNKWLVALAVSFGALMATIDLSIVNVALPQIRGSVGASIDEMASLVTFFAIAQVVVMPLTAFLGRFFGQKRVYLFCLGLFLVGSIICGLARTLPQLIAARAVQGLGAGALQPTQQAILRQTFPPEEQGMAMAMFARAAMVGPAVGPTLGGWIVDNWSWPWIFFINIPVGVVGILMVMEFVHEPPDIRAVNLALAERMRKNMDWLGIALMAIGLATTQYVLEQGPRDDWFDSPTIAVGVVVAAVGILGFIARELTAPAPAVNLRLFRDPVFTSATLIGGVMFAVLIANMFLLPVFMQELLGYTALQSGWALVPRTAAMMCATPIIGRMYNHVSPRLMVALGLVCVAMGSWEMGKFTLQTSTGGIALAMIIQGIGFALLFIPLTTVALSHVARGHISDATGLNALVRQFGGSVGLAIFTTLLTRYMAQARSGLVVHLDPSRPVVMQRLAAMKAALMQHGLDAGRAQEGALRALAGSVMRQAEVMAFDKTFVLAAGMMLALLLFVPFLRHPPREATPAGPMEVSHVEL